MTDDLVKRLTDHIAVFFDDKGHVFENEILCDEAADRIEELEAKLAKATGALERIVGGEFDGVMLLSLPPKDAARSYAASILAELKGDK